jgi:hypothetical protein
MTAKCNEIKSAGGCCPGCELFINGECPEAAAQNKRLRQRLQSIGDKENEE